ncbi:hypothetical protein ACL02R_06470 [Streptomyces sp. MS19]|uniref:hypothetical protein n=1 Tax=Streptomyces sp. MS19 TaxID=3385972 RepID=UPI0039A0DBD5
MNTEQSPWRSEPSPPAPARPAAPPGRARPVPPPATPPRPAAPPQPSVPPPPAAPPPTAFGPLQRSAALRLPNRTARIVAALACLVLGTGLLGGAAAGAWLGSDGDPADSAAHVFTESRELWRDLPVDDLFPPEISGEGTGPGGADRNWTRIAVAPDSGCADAFDPLLAEVLETVGCHRLVRATYSDETQTAVTTVGLLFTTADAPAMARLGERFADENLATRPDLLPRPFPAPGTPAEDFGDAQRVSWSIRVATDIPVVRWTVTGFADGRAFPDPEPAAEATAEGQDTTVALSGLGHEAQGLADAFDTRLREAAGRYAPEQG